ncbi:MAG: hypothetical protein CMC82_01055 [Flavobacteriaceae bacterium]|nr:hypothetical protein [Flavobacteriaceae bacterium]|tara:strand:- start:4058 stop:5275 length:1218 start_codon:yes stop_codon:yes gene_type:complete
MSLNDFLPFDFFTSEGGGFSLAGQAVRKSAATFDFYGNKDTFNAYIIAKVLGDITAQKLASYTGTSVDLSTTDLSEMAIYAVRIDDENSPHAFLPDPCDMMTVQEEGYGANKSLVREHTFMLGTGDLNIGDTIKIKLEKSVAGSYNLRFGTFVMKMGTDISKLGRSAEGCVSALELFDGASDIFNLDPDNLRAGIPAPTPLKTSEAGKDFLVGEEARRYQVYNDGGGETISSYEAARKPIAKKEGFPTIGIGHLIYKEGVVDERAKWAPYLGGKKSLTDKQVQDLFESDLLKYEAPGKRITKPVTQQMFDALVSLAFNAGPNSSAVRKCVNAINNEDYTGAARAISQGPNTSKGKFNKGLAKRRITETRYFLSGGIPKKGEPAGSTTADAATSVTEEEARALLGV